MGYSPSQKPFTSEIEHACTLVCVHTHTYTHTCLKVTIYASPRLRVSTLEKMNPTA